MNSALQKVSCVLVPLDFSDITKRVMATAADLAGQLGARVHLLHVVDTDAPLIAYEPGALPVLQPDIIRTHDEEKKQLDLLVTHLREQELEADGDQVFGHVVNTIVAQATEQSAGIIVMGSHGHGSVYNLLVGSVANGVLKSGVCPVLVVPAKY